ncbi:hypothetical protein R3P38DRAFT_3277408 [Favolaschia claudopus]|uniref:Uncharacterized protein n=1 Tax=Favolaschia claudopus TaxID=2862362 RepID=A0AAW0AM30_9AGAR
MIRRHPLRMDALVLRMAAEDFPRRPCLPPLFKFISQVYGSRFDAIVGAPFPLHPRVELELRLIGILHPSPDGLAYPHFGTLKEGKGKHRVQPLYSPRHTSSVPCQARALTLCSPTHTIVVRFPLCIRLVSSSDPLDVADASRSGCRDASWLAGLRPRSYRASDLRCSFIVACESARETPYHARITLACMVTVVSSAPLAQQLHLSQAPTCMVL